MTVPMEDYIAELLSAYEDATGEKHFKIAGDKVTENISDRYIGMLKQRHYRKRAICIILR